MNEAETIDAYILTALKAAGGEFEKAIQQLPPPSKLKRRGGKN
jgi:hypothetical protein